MLSKQFDYQQWLNAVSTTSDVELLLQAIDTLSDSLYRIGKQSWDEVRRSVIPLQLAKFFDIAETERKEYLDQLRGYLQNLKVMRLKIAVNLPADAIDRICSWVRENVAQDMILHIEVDPSLIAGAQISSEGKYIDLSKKSDLERIIEKYHG